jgi:hypothetical protein
MHYLLQTLFLIAVIMTFNRWLDARFPAPAKPAKSPKPPKPPYKRSERWSMGLGGGLLLVILTPAFLAVLPRMPLLSSIVVAAILFPPAILAIYHALKRPITAPVSIGSTGSQGPVEEPMLVPE